MIDKGKPPKVKATFGSKSNVTIAELSEFLSDQIRQQNMDKEDDMFEIITDCLVLTTRVIMETDIHTETHKKAKLLYEKIDDFLIKELQKK